MTAGLNYTLKFFPIPHDLRELKESRYLYSNLISFENEDEEYIIAFISLQHFWLVPGAVPMYRYAHLQQI